MPNHNCIKILLLGLSSTLIYPFHIHTMEKKIAQEKKRKNNTNHLLNATYPDPLEKKLYDKAKRFKNKNIYKPIFPKNTTLTEKIRVARNYWEAEDQRQNRLFLFTLLISGSMFAIICILLKYSSPEISGKFFKKISKMPTTPFFLDAVSFSRWLEWFLLK